jgi:hypothetical protein
LTAEAEKAEQEGIQDKASEFYLYVRYFAITEQKANRAQASICTLPHFKIPCASLREAAICLG